MIRSLVNLGPVSDFQNVAEMIERAFGEHRNGHAENGTGTPKSGWSLPIDVYERDGKLVVKAAVPGSKPEEVLVTIEEGVLTIKGETNQEFEESDKVYRREYRYGSFSRSIRLPEEIDVEAVQAQFENGFVKITLPKLIPAKPKTFNIPVTQVTEPDTVIEATTTPAKPRTKK